MATVYHRDQPGAPALVYANNAQSGFNAFKAIMKACLVDGYAGKPAAGWELINEGPAFIVLRNGSQSGFVCFTLLANVTRVYLAATYDGMNGDVMVGAGLKSGNSTASSLPQALNVRFLAVSPNSSTWVVIADEKTAVISCFSHSNSENQILNNVADRVASFTVCVGEDSSGIFVAAGGAATAATGQSEGISNLAYDGGFTALTNPENGLLVGADPLSLYIPATLSASAANAAPSYAFLSSYAGAMVGALATHDEVTLVPIRWQVIGALGGRLRGLALCPDVQYVTYPSVAAQYLGRADLMYVRDGNQPVSLGDGYNYFVRAGNPFSTFWLITDNPEFW